MTIEIISEHQSTVLLQSFVLDEALAQLQAAVATRLQALSGGALEISLAATSERASDGGLLQKVSR
jgi:hypothetical protein